MGHKILVVDDEWSIRDLLTHLLSIAGFEVETAANEDEFRQKALNIHPDVILLDLMLGSKDGAEIYDQLLKEGLDKNIPVVFVSALAQDRPSVQPRAGRKFSLVGKPFDSQKLIRSLHDLVENPIP